MFGIAVVVNYWKRLQIDTILCLILSPLCLKYYSQNKGNMTTLFIVSYLYSNRIQFLKKTICQVFIGRLKSCFLDTVM